jgi:hypothetical protein
MGSSRAFVRNESPIRRLPKLRMISITGASVATLDVAACSR